MPTEVEWVILYCPNCNTVKADKKHPSDPPNTTLVEIACYKCDELGFFDGAGYFDENGNDTWLAGFNLWRTSP